MKNAICTQLNITIHKKGFQAIFILMLLYALFVSLSYGYSQMGKDVSQLYHPAMLSALNADSEYIWFFIKLYPFLAVVPGGFLLFSDRSVGMSELFLARCSRLKYYGAKLCAAFLAAFFVFTVPFLLELLVNLVMLPQGAVGAMTNWETYSETYFIYADDFLLRGLFYQNIYIYHIVCVFLTGIFSGCVSVFLVGISTLSFKYRAFLLLPFYVVVYLTEMWMDKFQFPLSLGVYLTLFDATPQKSIGYYLGFMLLLLLTGIGCTVFHSRK